MLRSGSYYYNKLNSILVNNYVDSVFQSTKKTIKYSRMCDELPKVAAVCNIKVTNDKKLNLNLVKEVVKQSKAKNASMVFLPECSDFIGENRKETIALSETVEGDIVSAYRALAKDNNIWLSIGSIHEAIVSDTGSTEKIYNTHILINNTGDIAGIYRKLHLFDVERPDFRFRESDVVKAGPNIVPPIQTPIGLIGLQICYDLRFPEVALLLRQQGAQILTYPSAFTYSTGMAHWEILLRARAIENQSYVIAAAQSGWHNKKRQSYGHGIIIDPWGKVLADCGDSEFQVEVAEVNVAKIRDIEQSMPCFEHRRHDVYALTSLEVERSQDLQDTKFMFSTFLIPNSTVFYAAETCFVCTNIRCVVPGHVLVITKRSIPRIKDMRPDEVSDFFQTVQKVQKMLEQYYKTTSSSITVQDGEDAGQTVKHVHCHIMPRRKGDFEHNDLIYAELNNHDCIDNTSARRNIEDMAEEAENYRKFFKEMKQ